jgi:rRNA pseudouridine-1189 N-methylase Emg1 (Nep1/Mra1 family)
MISLILAESALELVPEKLQKHISVISHAEKLKKILPKSYLITLGILQQ